MKFECVQRAECNHRSTVDDRRSGSSSWLSVGGRVQPRVQTSARHDTRRFAAGGIEVANPFQRLLPATDSASANRLDHLRKAGFGCTPPTHRRLPTSISIILLLLKKAFSNMSLQHGSNSPPG
jgi:hypothetical protein